MKLSGNRKISYDSAINEALFQGMEKDQSVFLMGQGVKSAWYVGNTCKGLLEKFGQDRVIDTPISENCITGAGVGAALVGMRPVIVHPRMDFMFYAMDPIINQAANWSYMFGEKLNVPLVIWTIINRGGEQGAQHSQALQAFFAHVPGLKVVMPSNPYDAKGLLLSSIRENNPVIFIDDRWLYDSEGNVPQEIYEIPIGKAEIRKQGKDITVVATSFMVSQVLEAAEELNSKKIDVEVINLRTVKPFDRDLIFESVKKTGRIIIVDASWKSFGIGAEIAAEVSEKCFKFLKEPVKRLGLPDHPAPSSSSSEKKYYLNKKDIKNGIQNSFCGI